MPHFPSAMLFFPALTSIRVSRYNRIEQIKCLLHNLIYSRLQVITKCCGTLLSLYHEVMMLQVLVLRAKKTKLRKSRNKSLHRRWRQRIQIPWTILLVSILKSPNPLWCGSPGSSWTKSKLLLWSLVNLQVRDLIERKKSLLTLILTLALRRTNKGFLVDLLGLAMALLPKLGPM